MPKDKPKYEGYWFTDKRPIYVATNIHPVTPSNNALIGFYSSRQRFELILKDISSSGKANTSDPVRLIQDGLNSNLKIYSLTLRNKTTYPCK